ncbi:MAG: hypothetical protein ABIJ09_22750 [Pseudomonadota bacterium]
MSSPTRWTATRGVQIAAVLLLALYLGQAGIGLFHRELNSDELEHLHVAWSIAQGEVMYRDFFEHHGPLYGHLLAPLAQALPEARTLILSVRALSLVLLLLSLGLVYRLGVGMSGLEGPWARASAWLAVALLLQESFVARMAMEARPDVIMWPLALSSVLLLIRAADRQRWPLMLAAGALMGGALLATPRALFLGIGVVAFHLVRIASSKPGERGQAVARMAAYGAGSALPPLAVAGIYAAFGMLHEFVHYNLTYNLTYKVKIWPWIYLWESATSNPEFWFLGLAGLGLLLVDERRRSLGTAEQALSIFSLTGLIGMFVIHHPARQYFLVSNPWLAIVGARLLVRVLLRTREGSPGVLSVFVSALVAVTAGALLWPRPWYPPPASASVWLPTLILAVAVPLLSMRRMFFATAFALVMTASWFPLQVRLRTTARALYGERDTNHQQLRLIDALRHIVPEHGVVFDGFSNLGFQYRALDFRWFFHEELIAIHGRRGLVDYYQSRLLQRRPDVVLVDPNMRMLYGDDLWKVFPDYRTVLRTLWPGWDSPFVDVLVHAPELALRAQAPVERPPEPGMRTVRATDGRQVWIPGPIWRERRPVPILVELEPTLRLGHTHLVMRWSTDDDWATHHSSTGTLVHLSDRDQLAAAFELPAQAPHTTVELYFGFYNQVGSHYVNSPHDRDFRIRFEPPAASDGSE